MSNVDASNGCIRQSYFSSLKKETTLRSKQRVWRQYVKGKEFPSWLQEVPLENDTGECYFPALLFTRLEVLDLTCNRIQEIPGSVCNMKKLQMLHVSG